MNVDWLTLSQYSGETGSTTITGAVTDNLNIGISAFLFKNHNNGGDAGTEENVSR